MNIFGGNTDVTYDQLQRRKKMAEQLMTPGTPRNVGEGLSAIGKALIGRAVEKKTSRQETAMRDQFNERFGQVAGKQAQAMADLYGNPMASDMQKQILGALMKKGVPGMSRGGIARGGMTVVGEAGPELVELPKGARVAQADPLALEDELDSYMEQYKTPNDAPPEVLQRMDEIMRALNPPKPAGPKRINMENFYRNEREQRDPNYDPAMENFYRNEREQFDPNYKGREYPNMENFYRNELEQYAPQYKAPGSFDEGRFDDANAYQVADSGQIASDAYPIKPSGVGEQNTINTAANAYRTLLMGLDDYEKLIDEGGAPIVPGKQKDAIGVARRNLQMQMKELYNLGVLNGPDLMLMDQILLDPTGFQNKLLDILGIADTEERVDANVAQVKQIMRQMVEPKLKSMGLDPESVAPAPKDVGAMSDEELLRALEGGS